MTPVNSQTLPAPDPEALQHSERLRDRILAEIDAAGGAIGFSRFMQMALYEPGLGYYSAGAAKFGAGGDFVTAADLGDFLARAIVKTIVPSLAVLVRPIVVEIGAGTGALAADILRQLDACGFGDLEYRILETSPELRARQRRALEDFAGRVTWLERLEPDSVEGLILANEVADALPVDRVVSTPHGWEQLAVARAGRAFEWVRRPLSARMHGAIESIMADLPQPPHPGFVSEVSPLLAGWIEMLCAALSRGSILIVDYGMSRREYFHPQRDTGTLMCHYRHRAHPDPFVFPGLQDITAWVDFSACAQAARASGAAVAGYTTQGSWIAETLLGDPSAAFVPDFADAARLKTLLLPGEMGERFKALLLNCRVDSAQPLGLAGRDLRSRL
ncbi:MAG: SAM-dependent methyltransferase [Gammaproteobacteria bacterium]